MYLNTKNCFEIALPTFRYVSVFYLQYKHANYSGKRPQKLHLETKDYEGVKVQNKIWLLCYLKGKVCLLCSIDQYNLRQTKIGETPHQNKICQVIYKLMKYEINIRFPTFFSSFPSNGIFSRSFYEWCSTKKKHTSVHRDCNDFGSVADK